MLLLMKRDGVHSTGMCTARGSLLLVCGCHFSFAAVMTFTCLPSLNMYLLLSQIDNNNNNINVHFGYVHHMNNILKSRVEVVLFVAVEVCPTPGCARRREPFYAMALLSACRLSRSLASILHKHSI
jgi:hypothetical protein